MADNLAGEIAGSALHLGGHTGGGVRLGGGRQLRPPSATNQEPDVIVIEDSSDEEDKASAPSQGTRRTTQTAGIDGGDYSELGFGRLV